MANYCFTTYIVEGKKETLESLMNTINTVAKRVDEAKEGVLNLSAILIELGLYTEESLKEATNDYSEETPEGLGIAGDWRDAEMKVINGQEVLTFHEEYKWMPSRNMEILADMEPFSDGISGVYRRSEESGCGNYETNDEEGKYFPEKYVVCLEQSDGEYLEGHYNALDEVSALFLQNYPEVGENATIEQMQEYAEEHDFCFCCDEILGATGISAGEYRKIAEQIVAEHFKKQ